MRMSTGGENGGATHDGGVHRLVDLADPRPQVAQLGFELPREGGGGVRDCREDAEHACGGPGVSWGRGWLVLEEKT